jgi:MoaA/NifB/PqqE/SkfB family radical SAM enzyme
MCSIWKKSPQSDLSLDEIKALLVDPVLSDLRTMTLTGGEPFQREDIFEVCNIINNTSKNLIQLYLSTNGFDFEGISRKIQVILNLMPNIKRLRIGISFDHIGIQHDKIRGQKSIHNNALSLLKKLRNVQDPRLTVQGNLTIGPYNVVDLYEIYEYFKNLDLKVFWFPISVSDNFYENSAQADKLAFSPKEQTLLKEFVVFLRHQRLSIPDYYYYTGLHNSLRRGTRSFPCSGGSKFLLINSVGEVYPCYIIPKSYRMGSARENSLGEIWYSEEANRIRRIICKNPTCSQCTQWYDGYALSHSLRVFSGLVLVHPVRVVKQFVNS